MVVKNAENKIFSSKGYIFAFPDLYHLRGSFFALKKGTGVEKKYEHFENISKYACIFALPDLYQLRGYFFRNPLRTLKNEYTGCPGNSHSCPKGQLPDVSAMTPRKQRPSDPSHAGSAGKQYRSIGHDKGWANNDTSARQCSPHDGGICMFRVGKDTRYSIYDSGYRKKSFGIDTVGTCASSQSTTVIPAVVSVGA